MEIGANIRKLREKQGLTQEQLAEKLDVSFQAISSWERDEYLPEASKLIKLASILSVSIDDIVYGVEEKPIKTKKAIYNWEHMKTYIKTKALDLCLAYTQVAVHYACLAHEGQTRKNSDIPYIYHPLCMACHALSMGIEDDEILAAILMHDVIEDNLVIKPEDVLRTFNDQTAELIKLLSKEDVDDSMKDDMLDKYYAAIAQNPKAALIKCIDRCNNLSTMAWGFDREHQRQYLIEVDKYYPELLNAIKRVPEYSNYYWLLKYQIESMLDIYNELI